jgi:hypothetical protein
MPEAAYTQDRNQVARLCPAVAQAHERRHARVHEWRGFDKREGLGDPGECHRRPHHVVGVAAVIGDSRDERRRETEPEVAAPALLAPPAVPPVPTDADPVSFRPAFDPLADGVDDARDLVPGHARVCDPGHETFLRQHVAVTDAIRFHNPHVAGTGRRDVSFDDLERSSRPRYLDYTHLGHALSLLDVPSQSVAPKPQ